MKLIVGLGNPGAQHAETRHNVGWQIAEELAGRTRAGPWKEKFDAAVAEIRWHRRKVILARPLTFMNRSGVAVRQLVDFWKVTMDNVLVILDDLNLELGRIRLRGEGSDGGHNGLRSVIEHLGHEQVPRLRVGIGPSLALEPHAEFVLSSFTPEEQAKVAEVVARAADAVECWITDGIEKAMSRFNPAD